MPQKRRRTRVVAQKDATLCWSEESRPCRIENLSLKGCLVSGTAAPLPAADQPVTVRIHLEPGEPSLDVEVRGRVVRYDGPHVAVDFTEVPAENFPDLFRLVQYNASDPEGIEGELPSSAFGSRPDDG